MPVIGIGIGVCHGGLSPGGAPPEPPAWSPLELSPAGWFKADVGVFQERTGASATTPALLLSDPVGTWQDQSGNCITGDTRGFFSAGFLQVQDVTEPMGIYQDGGLFGQIKHYWKREYKGKVVRVKARGLPRIGLTPQHEVLRVDGQSVRALRRFKQTHSTFPKDYKLVSEWAPASDLQVGDYLLMPKPSLPTREVMIEPFPREYAGVKGLIFADFAAGLSSTEIAERHGAKIETVWRYRARFNAGEEYCQKGVAGAVLLDEEWAELFGWYAAEGCARPQHGKETCGKVKFCLSHLETEQAERIADLLRRKANVRPYLRRQGTALNVVCTSNPFAYFLLEHFGDGALQKRIPEWLLEAEPDILRAFLEAFNLGDGCVTRCQIDKGYSWIDFATSSEKMVSSLALALMKLGVLPAIIQKHEGGEMPGIGTGRGGRTMNCAPAWTVRVTGADVAKLVQGARLAERCLKETYLQDEDHFYVRISKLDEEDYDGLVYDFESDTHTLGMPCIIHNSRHLTAATDATRGSLHLGLQNGRPGIRFDGTDDRLINAALGALFSGSDVPQSVFFVSRSNTPARVYQTEVFIYQAASGTPVIATYNPATATGNNWSRRDDLVNQVSLAFTDDRSSFRILEWVFAGTTVTVRHNGTAVLTNAAIDVGTITLDRFSVGGGGPFTDYFLGDICEVLAFPVALAAGDATLLRTYLSERFAITVV